MGERWLRVGSQANAGLHKAAAIFGKNHDRGVVTLQRLGNSWEPGSAALSDVPSEQPHCPELTLSRAAVAKLGTLGIANQGRGRHPPRVCDGAGPISGTPMET